MSYDYAALVRQIAAVHHAGDWAGVCQHCETLSSHCPMTPLLWVQYAHAVSVLLDDPIVNEGEGYDNDDGDGDGAQEDATPPTSNKAAILELALLEFPQSSLLHFVSVLEAHRLSKCRRASSLHYESRLREALDAVGRGSHLVDPMVYALYRLALEHYSDGDDSCKRGTPHPELWNTLLRCLEFCPLMVEGTVDSKGGALAAALSDRFAQTPGRAQQVEEARKAASRHYQQVRTYEDDITIALSAQGIAAPEDAAILEEASSTTAPWWISANVETCPFGMGLGNLDSARAFLRYGRALSKHGKSALALAVYERAIVECPTIEHVWSDYAAALQQQIGDQSSDSGLKKALLARLDSVLTRALRNCPYSMRLAQRRLTTSLFFAQHDHAVVDPEHLLEQAHQALATKFLESSALSGSSAALELYLTVLWVIRQRILALLAQPVLPNAAEPENGDDGAALPVEVQDLCEDLMEVYEELDQCFKNKHPQGKETQQARCSLWRDGSKTLQWLVSPLQSPPQIGSNHQPNGKALKWAQLALKMYNPPHPDMYLDYLHQLLQEMPRSPNKVLQWIQSIQSTFAKAIRCVGRPNPPAPRWRDYDLALQQLGQEWLEFEQTVGTEQSLQQAREAVHKKLTAAAAAAAAAAANRDFSSEGGSIEKPSHASGNKRGASGGNEPDSMAETEPPAKRAKESEAVASAEEMTGVTQNDARDGVLSSTEPTDVALAAVASPKNIVTHKVRIGKLDFPAHPYTVRVLNLSPDTEDMDLVDTFKRCGAIVHARILREKHGVGRHAGIPPSKGWGLVQFEERDAVDAALELSDVVGLHEKILKVERSHIPAAILVPPGMHRVNEKGHGKYSKRNERRKQAQHHPGGDAAQSKSDPSGLTGSDRDTNKEDDSKGQEASSASKPASSSMGVLSFRPRGIGRGGHQKPRISLTENKK